MKTLQMEKKSSTLVKSSLLIGLGTLPKLIYFKEIKIVIKNSSKTHRKVMKKANLFYRSKLLIN